jgi:hypothetical protein
LSDGRPDSHSQAAERQKQRLYRAVRSAHSPQVEGSMRVLWLRCRAAGPGTSPPMTIPSHGISIVEPVVSGPLLECSSLAISTARELVAATFCVSVWHCLYIVASRIIYSFVPASLALSAPAIYGASHTHITHLRLESNLHPPQPSWQPTPHSSSSSPTTSSSHFSSANAPSPSTSPPTAKMARSHGHWSNCAPASSRWSRKFRTPQTSKPTPVNPFTNLNRLINK